MNQQHPRRISLLDNFVSLNSSPEKPLIFNQEPQFSTTSIKTLSSFPPPIKEQLIEDSAIKVIQWRKNLHENVVGIKHCKYSIIKTVNKCIKIPAYIQTEKIAKRLDEFKGLSSSDSLLILSSILEGYSTIKNYFGYITFELRFCGISVDGKVKVWINSDFNANQADGKLIQDESEAVLKIIQEIKKISANQFSQFYCYYLRNARKTICDFSKTLTLIKSYLSCTKLNLPEKISIYKCKQNKTSLSPINFCKTPTYKKYGKAERMSLAPDFLVKNDRNQSQHKKVDRPISNIKNSISETKITLKKTISKSVVDEGEAEKVVKNDEKSPQFSGIVNQFSMSINPQKQSGTGKESSVSTANKTNSNKRSNYMGQTQNVFDWSMKTFSKVDKLPTHQSENNFTRASKLQQLQNMNSLFEGIKEQCNSESSPEKGRNDGEDSAILRREKQQQILQNNQWTNKISSLFASKQIKESTILGKDPEQILRPMKTQNLDKWVRVVGESMLPLSQNN